MMTMIKTTAIVAFLLLASLFAPADGAPFYGLLRNKSTNDGGALSEPAKAHNERALLDHDFQA